MKAEEMTCAIPVQCLGELLDTLGSTVTLNRSTSSYALADAKRFR